jgi:hypothetical protein
MQVHYRNGPLITSQQFLSPGGGSRLLPSVMVQPRNMQVDGSPEIRCVGPWAVNGSPYMPVACGYVRAYGPNGQVEQSGVWHMAVTGWFGLHVVRLSNPEYGVWLFCCGLLCTMLPIDKRMQA